MPLSLELNGTIADSLLELNPSFGDNPPVAIKPFQPWSQS
jgi:hypothetical protein